MNEGVDGVEERGEREEEKSTRGKTAPLVNNTVVGGGTGGGGRRGGVFFFACGRNQPINLEKL